jgi:hypothetical protein
MISKRSVLAFIIRENAVAVASAKMDINLFTNLEIKLV